MVFGSVYKILLSSGKVGKGRKKFSSFQGEFGIWKFEERLVDRKHGESMYYMNIFGDNNAVFCQRRKCNSRGMYPQIHGISLPRWRGAIKVSWTVSRGNEGREECVARGRRWTVPTHLIFRRKNCSKSMTTATAVDENRPKLNRSSRTEET